MLCLKMLFWRRKRTQADFSEELQAHLALEADRLREEGVSEEEASTMAQRNLGNITQTKERFYESHRWLWLDTLLQDLRFGLRQLRRNPGFTAVAVITLALGIGANTAIFSLIDALMLRSMPVRNPAQLVVLRWSGHKSPGFYGYSSFGDCSTNMRTAGASGCSFSFPFFEKLQAKNAGFSSLTAFAGPAELDLSGNGPASIARGEFVSGDYFSTLGVRSAVGRTIIPADDFPGASPVVVLSYAYWQKAFGGERSAVGRTINLNNVPFTIVGVASRSFTRLSPGKMQDFWLPIAMLPRLGIPWAQDIHKPTSWWVVIVGRLKPGVSRARAQAAANLLFRNELLHGAKPLSKPADSVALTLVPAQKGLSGIRGQFSTQLYVLMFAVGFILLITCANVAGLLLARAAARTKEMAVRLAIGAGRARIWRQLLTESLLLSLTGGALGVVFAYWGVRVITGLISTHNSPTFRVAPDGRILVFTIAISLITGILFGLAPALRSTHLDLTPALKESASSTPGSRTPRSHKISFGDTLVVLQVGLSIVVLAGAGLLVRTLENLRTVNPGFDTHNILLFGLDPTLAGYKDTQIQSLYRNLQEQLAAIPGVISVSYSSDALLSGSLWTTGRHLVGMPEKKSLQVDALTTGPGFFRTLRIPLLEGRAFTSADFEQAAKAKAASNPAGQSTSSKVQPARATAPIPVLVNTAFVRTDLHNKNPLGKLLAKNTGPWDAGKPPEPDWEIIGVVGDTRYSSLRREVHPAVFIPQVGGGARFEMRTAGNPKALISAVRSAVKRVNSRLPLFDISTQSQTIDDLLMRERLVARLGTFFGALALLLACIGLYGLLAYEVVRRTHELGIRVALGAQKKDVLRHVLGRGMILALVGAAIGIGAALGLNRFLTSLLYNVKATDPLTFAAVSLILLGVALLACYIPAQRATKVDPMVALRHE
ncbi:MAG TPA: ABC transporter permease [Terriglobia bacterium]|nr:ABC transporter permease [Terriglobia bacterium]